MLFQRRDQEGDREAFWRKTEEEIGEGVRIFALARCTRGCAPGDEPLWGVLFFTESSLFFRHFEQKNWFSALTTVMSGEGTERREVYFSVPRSTIVSAELERPGGKLSRIFTYQPPVLYITHTHQGEAASELRFTVDTNPEQIARELGISD